MKQSLLLSSFRVVVFSIVYTYATLEEWDFS